MADARDTQLSNIILSFSNKHFLVFKLVVGTFAAHFGFRFKTRTL